MISFVGAGPGAVDLITVRGKICLEKADVIIYAGSLVNPELLACRKKSCKVYDSAKMTLEEVFEVMLDSYHKDEYLVRLHTGDPCLYGAIREQMDLLDKEKIPYEYIPGVSSFCGAASALNVEYTLPGVSQTVIITRESGRTAVPEKESLQSLAAHKASMVLFLSTGLVDKVQEDLLSGAYTKDTPAAVVYKATWKDEKKYFCTVGTLADCVHKNNLTNTALLIIGESLSHSDYSRSCLYNPSFETGFRKKKE